MSRIKEILNEEISAQINGKQYKFHTDAGNLFRLMLVVNPDQPIPQAGAQNLVSKMLPDLSEKNEKDVKKLQTIFNKIKKVSLSGKKPTVAMKKEYFALLFSLMLPLTAQANFKPAPLTASFSSGGKNAVDAQRKATVLIGKSLLTSEEVELNAKDKMLIKGYIMGLEELSGAEEEVAAAPETVSDEVKPAKADTTDVTEVEVQPEDAVSQIVNSEKTVEELNATVAQTDEVINNVKNLNQDKTAELSDMLKNNKSSDRFVVNLTDADAEAAPMVNELIKDLYAKTAAEYGQQTANFVAQFVSDGFKNLNSLNGYLNFLKDDIKAEVVKTGDGFQINMGVGSEGIVDDEHRFFMMRKFKISQDGRMNVYNDRLQVPESAQGSGINKKIFKDSLDLYKARGVEKITLQANVDVGGYAWFRYGFVPQDNFQISGIARWMTDVAPVIVDSLQYDAEDVANFVAKQTYKSTPGTENLVALMKGGKTPEADKVINKLLAKCADEFQETFDDKSKFKELGKKIAIMNFKDYTIAGKAYSISYKALLSIQALNVDGFKPVPMSSYHGDIHLGWMGELDMKDLDDTYAYLNL